MNKYIKIAIYYAALGLFSGVFYREFTKFNGVDGGTNLVNLHFHTLMLGMFFFLLLAIFEDKFSMSKLKGYRLFSYSYHIGLHITLAVFVVRGFTEVFESEVSKGLDASLSGIGGIGHILLSVGLITMLVILNKASKIQESKK